MGVDHWTGAHDVGVCDIEWASQGLRNVKPDDLNPSQHFVGRLFYPGKPGARAPGVGAGTPKRGQPWISSLHEATGYVSFMFFRTKAWWAQPLKLLLRCALWLVGVTQRLPLFREAAVDDSHAQYPVVIFSHGLGGSRSTYSVFCSELASQGYVVLAVEHTDGTASSVHFAGSGGWWNYRGLGEGEAKFNKVRWRQRELATAQRLLAILNAGSADPAQCQVSGGTDVTAYLRGKLDMGRLAIAGHSFGGATVGAAAAKDSAVRAAVALDPWWLGVPPDEPALKAFHTRTPLLVIGSHAWNKPYNAAGDMVCGAKEQAAILAAASAGSDAGGALLLAVEDSTHDTFSDLPVLFATRFSWLLKRVGFDTKLDPALGMAAVTATTVLFLHKHLPTATPPKLPDFTPGSGKQPTAAAADASQARSQRQPQPTGSDAAEPSQLPHNDSGWSLVSADDADGAARNGAASAQDGADARASNGTGPGGRTTPETPSEATRTDAASAGRVSPGGAGINGSAMPASLDPAAGAEADALGGRQGADAATAAAPPKGGAFLPSAAELRGNSTGARPSSNSDASRAIGLADGTHADAAQQRRSPAEATKIAVSEATRTATAQLLGKLAAILELHA